MKIVRKQDLVSLRNNNPDFKSKTMQVLDVSNTTDKVLCSWVGDNGKIETGFFSSNSLRKININRHKKLEKL